MDTLPVMTATRATALGASRKDRIYTRDEVEVLISEGRHVFIHMGRIIKVDAWVKYHPGGDKAIRHMIGRDATDEVNALHSLQARERMNKYVMGRITGRWVNFTPPIQGGYFRSREEIESGQPGQADPIIIDERDSSSRSSSEEPSPVFDPADRATTLRKRFAQPSTSRSSSATSISSMDIAEHPAKEVESAGDKRTRQELEYDLAKYPSLDADTQEEINRKYRVMFTRMQDEKLFDCNYAAYGIEILRYSFLFSMFLLTLHWGWYGTSGAFLGAMWHQLVFSVHDAGHMAITHNYQMDTIMGIIGADFIGGLSIGWWKRSHNVHHIVTNSPEHDPDIELMPFFAVSHRFFDSLRSTYYDRIMTYDAFSQFVVQYQHFLYYPMLLFGRFNLYFLSWDYLIRGQGPRKGAAAWHRWLEVAGHIFFWYWFGYKTMYQSIDTWVGRFAFLMISHMITAPLHVQITLSHYAMSTSDMGVAESFAQRMLRTTMDVDCPQWLDFFHGGLQFQAIHHLYPRMPRHNLRRAQKIVQEFANDTGIPYALYTFYDGNKEVIGHLADVARQASVLAACQKSIVESGDFGMHH